MKLLKYAMALSILAGTGLTSVRAQSWDATSDFTPLTTTNPNGVWSYGYDPASTPGYDFKAFDFLGTTPSLYWLDSSYSSLGTPSFGKNVTSSDINGLPPGMLFLHPGPAPDGDAAILRFTAPGSGPFNIAAQFFAGDSSETVAWLVLNGDFSNPLRAVGATGANPAVSLPGLGLAAGDTLDFVVGNAGSYFSDTTPLTVVISLVPEPAAIHTTLAGLGTLAAVLALRRKKPAAAVAG